MKLKGISPLIAAVLLIAFTMAIAGIMAIWATTFSTQRLETAATCPALTVSDISASGTGGGNVSVRLINVNRNIKQTGIIASFIYSDPTKNLENQVPASPVPNELAADGRGVFKWNTTTGATTSFIPT